MDTKKIGRKSWIPEAFLAASLVPVIPQVMELAEEGTGLMSPSHIRRLTGIAILSILLLSLYLWSDFRGKQTKSMRYDQVFLIMGSAIVAMPVSLALAGERGAYGEALLMFALLGAVFVFVAFLDYARQRKRSSVSTLYEYAVSGARLCGIYLVGLLVLLAILFLATVWSSVWPHFEYFWQDMGETWLRGLYSMGLIFNAIMAILLTVMSTKLSFDPRTAVVRFLLLAILFWLCLETDDLIEYYTW